MTATSAFPHHGEATARRPTLAEIRKWPATVSVADAARAMGISRSAAYEWIRTGEFPVATIVRRNRRVVITAGLVKLLSETDGYAGRYPTTGRNQSA